MSIKSAVSALAVASAMLVGPAFAQDAMATQEWTISGNPVSEMDQSAVKARCDDLQREKETQSLTDDPTDDEQATGDQADAGVTDAGTINNPATDSETATTIDLSLITLEDCEAGGWYAM